MAEYQLQPLPWQGSKRRLRCDRNNNTMSLRIKGIILIKKIL